MSSYVLAAPQHYIDLTSNGIGTTNTSTIGTNSDFTTTPVTLFLDEDYEWYMQLIQWFYVNTDLSPAQVQPIVLCDQILPIREAGTQANILFKGSYAANDALEKIDGVTVGIPMYLRLSTKILSTIRIYFQRSDNGQAFPFPDGSYVTVLVALYRVAKEKK